MPIYPSKLLSAFYAIAELMRCMAATRSLEWVAWYRQRLADRSLSEQRRRTLGGMLASISMKRVDPSLALDVWSNGRDLWAVGLRTPIIAVLACEAALWLKEEKAYADAFSVGRPLFSESTRLRLEFLRSMYGYGSQNGEPRDIHLPLGLPHDAALPFVDHYARARAADAEGRFGVALEYYTKSLRTLPVDHEAYEFARNRDYEIRNNKMGESNQPLHAIAPKRRSA